MYRIPDVPMPRYAREVRGAVSPTSFHVLAGRTRRCYARRRRVRAQDDDQAGEERAWILSWTRNAVHRAERSGAEQSRAEQGKPGQGAMSLRSHPLPCYRAYTRDARYARRYSPPRACSLFLSLFLSFSTRRLLAFYGRAVSRDLPRDFPERERKSFPPLRLISTLHRLHTCVERASRRLLLSVVIQGDKRSQ